jgi:hypothetical protein
MAKPKQPMSRVVQVRECYIVSVNAPARAIATRRHDLGTACLGGAVASDRRLVIAPVIVLHRDKVRAKTRRDWFRDSKGAGRPHRAAAVPPARCVLYRSVTSTIV